jgi:sterol desaturase/sphingolipid hydroxylase (fatty acid hydroxylase superfamily)
LREFYSNFPLIALLSLPRFGIAIAAATAIFLLDYLIRRRPAMFRTRTWVHDILYYAFYNSILAVAILAVPERRLFLPLLKLLDWQILATLPVLPGFVTFFVAADFVSYWHHRWMHSRFLWAFHSVHHEQRELTAFTSARKHLVEAATTPILLLALAAVLGSPPQDALWFFVLKYLKDATLHSGLRWSYGPLYWIVVSPLFHSAHHSTEVEVSNSNFGVFFSFWDMIFGTHRYTSSAPDRQGVEGLSMPTLWSQFWLPFKMAQQGNESAPTSPELASATVNRE